MHPVEGKVCYSDLQHDFDAFEKEDAAFKSLPEKQVDGESIRKTFFARKGGGEDDCGRGNREGDE